MKQGSAVNSNMELYKYKTVLLIDDSYIDNQISSKILESSYFAEEIMVVLSPGDVIDFIRTSINIGTDLPEVLFLDIRMPGMNGFDFLKELETIPQILDHKIKIYILSSSLDPKDHKMMLQYKSVSGFISKPLSSQILEGI